MIKYLGSLMVVMLVEKSVKGIRVTKKYIEHVTSKHIKGKKEMRKR